MCHPPVPQDLADELVRPSVLRAVEDVLRPADSAMRPSSMKIARFATSRTIAISWLTINIVMPSANRPRTVSGTSLTSSGSGAEVTPSGSGVSGFRQGPRAMAACCCRPPGISPGNDFSLSAKPALAKTVSASAITTGRGRFLTLSSAIVTFHNTSMFWNRLYCRNTAATRSRTWRRLSGLPYLTT